jgi:hypothetical protein
MSMPAIGRMSERNLVGLCHLDVVAVDDVASVPPEAAGNVASAVVLNEGASWSRVYLDDAGGRFVEKWVLKAGDQHSEAEISGAIAKDRLALMPQLWRMKGKRYLVLFTTQNGDTLLMGRVETPAIALVSERRAGDAEQLQNDRNEYRISFTLQRRHPVPFYLGELPEPPPSTCDPVTAQLNSTTIGTPASGSTFNYQVLDTNDAAVGSIDGGVWRVPAVIIPSGIAYQFGYALWSGQQVSYRTGDEGWLFQNGWFDYTPPVYPLNYAKMGADWYTLQANNIHGNTSRFTDRTGAQTYATAVVQDHLTGIEHGLLIANSAAAATWNNVIDGAEGLTLGGDSDWHANPLKIQIGLYQLLAALGVGDAWEYPPFDADSVNMGNALWTSTTNPAITTAALRITQTVFGGYASQAKTNTNQYRVCRRFI